MLTISFKKEFFMKYMNILRLRDFIEFILFLYFSKCNFLDFF